MRIARHAVWADNLPPKTFGEIGGFHHKPTQSGPVGPAVWRAVSSGRMEQASWSDDQGVRDHRARHYHQFDRTPPWEDTAAEDAAREEAAREAEEQAAQ